MIIGIGSDIVDIRRIEQILDRFGERFTARCFTERERAKCDQRATRAAAYARRFAAKEAAAKALGTGFQAGVFWRDLEVVNLPSGQPTLHMTGGALRRLQALIPSGQRPQIDLSLTDEPPLAQAFVILSATPETSTLPFQQPLR